LRFSIGSALPQDMRRSIYLGIGFIALMLGALGAFLPLLRSSAAAGS
jgi:hypothetical protein